MVGHSKQVVNSERPFFLQKVSICMVVKNGLCLQSWFLDIKSDFLFSYLFDYKGTFHMAKEVTNHTYDIPQILPEKCISIIK